MVGGMIACFHMALVFAIKQFFNQFFVFLSILLGAILKGLTFQKLDVCVCMFCFIFVQGLILWV